MNIKTELRKKLKCRIDNKIVIENLLEELLILIKDHSIDFEEWINNQVLTDEPTEVLYKKFKNNG